MIKRYVFKQIPLRHKSCCFATTMLFSIALSLKDLVIYDKSHHTLDIDLCTHVPCTQRMMGCKQLQHYLKMTGE